MPCRGAVASREVIAEGQEQQTQTFGLAALALAGGDESQSSREMWETAWE